MAVHTGGAHGAAAIDVRFAAILHHVHTRGRRALHHRIAVAAHAIAVAHAALADHAIGHARSAAIDVGLVAIDKSVITRRSCTHFGHGIAETARAVIVHPAALTVHAIVRARSTTIDVGFRAVFLAVRAARNRARHSRANLAQAIGGHATLFAVRASAARSAAVSVRFRSILRHVATLCGLTNVVLTNVRHAIRARIAFDARPRGITEFSAAFITGLSDHLRRIRGHSCGTRIDRTSLVVARRIGIVILRSNAAITIANRLLAISRRLRLRRRIGSDVRLDARSHHAIDRDAFIRGGRAIIRRHANRSTTCSTHSSTASAAHSGHSAHSTSTSLTAAARR